MQYSVTHTGLCKWTKEMFSKLGWMLIAKREKRGYRLKAYLEDLKHLEAAVAERIASTIDGDRTADLKIMLENVGTLRAEARKLLGDAADFRTGTLSNSNANANASNASNATQATNATNAAVANAAVANATAASTVANAAVANATAAIVNAANANSLAENATTRSTKSSKNSKSTKSGQASNVKPVSNGNAKPVSGGSDAFNASRLLNSLGAITSASGSSKPATTGGRRCAKGARSARRR